MLWEHPDHPCITVHFKELAVADGSCGMPGAYDRRNAKLPRYDSAVAEDAAGIGNYGRSSGEQGCPGR